MVNRTSMRVASIITHPVRQYQEKKELTPSRIGRRWNGQGLRLQLHWQESVTVLISMQNWFKYSFWPIFLLQILAYQWVLNLKAPVNPVHDQRPAMIDLRITDPPITFPLQLVSNGRNLSTISSKIPTAWNYSKNICSRRVATTPIRLTFGLHAKDFANRANPIKCNNW